MFTLFTMQAVIGVYWALSGNKGWDYCLRYCLQLGFSLSLPT